MWCLLAMAWAEEPPAKVRRTWAHGDTSIALGTAFAQIPGYGRGNRSWPGVNVNGTLKVGVPKTPLLFGIHSAFHRVTFDQGRQSTEVVRLEARAGGRVPLWKTAAFDLTAGFAFDLGGRFGPTVQASLEQWLPLGKNPRWFVSLEGRLAPIAGGYRTLMGCDGYCNQTHNYNPGGTGVLISFGRSFKVGS